MAVDNPSYFSLSSGAASSSSTPSTSTPASTTSVAFSPPSKGFTALFRRRPNKMGSSTSASVVSASTTSTLMQQESNRSSASGGSTPSTPTEERVPMLPRNGTVQGANGTAVNQRRSFRNLFRSVSANADAEKTQQFLKGDPRPSDVAPPSPYLPHRSHSHSENDRRRPGRSRAVLKSASELLSNDMVYCGLARDSHDNNHADDDDDEDDRDSGEVFVGVDDARYYNLSSTLPAPGSAAAGRRRHSIGTFLGKDRASTSKDASRRQPPTSSTVLVEPDTMAPPIPVDTVDGVHGENRKGRSCSRSRRRRHRSSSSRGK